MLCYPSGGETSQPWRSERLREIGLKREEKVKIFSSEVLQRQQTRMRSSFCASWCITGCFPDECSPMQLRHWIKTLTSHFPNVMESKHETMLLQSHFIKRLQSREEKRYTVGFSLKILIQTSVNWPNRTGWAPQAL